MSFKELLALFIVFAISIDMTVSAKIHKGKPIFRSFHKIKSKVDITDRRHYPCAEGEDPCIDDVVNFSAIRHYGHERASLQFQKDLESGIEIKTFLDMSEIETCHSSAEDVIRAIRIFNTMEKHFKHIHLEHDKNKYQATLRHAFRQVFDRQIIHSHNTILEELETLATVTTDNQDQISVIQCYFDQQATATTSHASACFNTTAFVLEKFDNLYHTLWALDIIKNKGNESEFLAEDKAKIESARNSLRNLIQSQWRHVKTICYKKPSEVRSSGTSMTSLAQKISSYKATCNWTEPIRLSNRFECLEIQCGAEETGRTFTNKCDQMSHAAIADEHWFISTQFIAAQDPFRESVCQVGLATARLQDPQRHHYYNLLYLDAIVCDEKTGRNQSRSSCTKDTALHQTVRYPFHYDPESIALNHPRPFSVWRIGLYLDPRSRIAVTISTIKPLTVNHCSRNSSEFEQAHKEFFLPEFDM